MADRLLREGIGGGGVQLIRSYQKGQARIRLCRSPHPRAQLERAVWPHSRPSAANSTSLHNPIPDLVPLLLKIRVLDRRVEIQRRLLHPLKFLQVQRPFIQDFSTRPPIWGNR